MNDKLSLEEKVSFLENEIKKLKQGTVKSESGPSWPEKCGTFKNDPDFMELLRLGQEFRNAYPDDTPA